MIRLHSAVSRRSFLAMGGAAMVADGLWAAERKPRGFGDLQSWIEREVKEGRVVGAAISIARDGATLWERGFGFADRASWTPATAATPFGLASVTKPFTTAAVMAGKIDLDAPIETVLPFRLPHSEFAVAGVTPRRLGGHASGLPSLFQLAKSPGQPPPVETLGKDFGRLAYPPGEIYEYSNIGFQLLGAALSHAEKASFEAAVHRRIIRPMGLRDTFFLSEQGDGRRSATRYAADGAPIPFYTTVTPASGELCSSVRDLSLFAANLMTSRAKLDEICKPVFRAADGRFAAFGWMGFHVDGELMLVKNGSDPGVAARLILMPERKLSIAVVTNTSDDDFVAAIGDRIASIFVPHWLGRHEDIPSRLTGGDGGAVGSWQGTITNNGVTLPVEMQIGSGNARLRIDGRDWAALDKVETIGGIFTAECTGRIADGTEATPTASLQFRLLPRSDRLVGRVLEREANSTLPYIVDMVRIR